MNSTHKILYKDARALKDIDDKSISLVITSPPYPMIEMWDEVFSSQNGEIKEAIQVGNGTKAFELMHAVLDNVWKEMDRVLCPGGIACINIGDATRTVGDQFQLYPSHARIIKHFREMGFQSLPEILWRKQTNAPNKFMGSGMLPPSAYVTLEHEFILIFRKYGKREFTEQAKIDLRNASAYFWEERNAWFSDVWEFKGITQVLENGEARKRSAAFPFDLAYRLVNMFSIKGDTIIDPFLGTGTSMLAAMASGRNSIGVEIDRNLEDVIAARLKAATEFCNEYIENRLKAHVDFVNDRLKNSKELKYHNQFFDIPVMTRQEAGIEIPFLKCVKCVDDTSFIVEYEQSALHGTGSRGKNSNDMHVHKPLKNKGLFEWV